MRKGWIITFIISAIILFTIGVGIGIFAYQKNQVHDSNQSSTKLAHQNEDKNESIITNELISTSNVEEKISPNCTIVEKQYFKGCDHLVKDIKEIPTNWINFNQEQIKSQYPNWTLESFTGNQIIVSQEKEGYCSQHYIIREHNGVIGIYILNEEGDEIFKEDTEIATRYLSEEDLQKLQEGIKAIGDEKLHKTLEDFE